jgi:hypothetical protein
VFNFLKSKIDSTANPIFLEIQYHCTALLKFAHASLVKLEEMAQTDKRNYVKQTKIEQIYFS